MRSKKWPSDLEVLEYINNCGAFKTVQEKEHCWKFFCSLKPLGRDRAVDLLRYMQAQSVQDRRKGIRVVT